MSRLAERSFQISLLLAWAHNLLAEFVCAATVGARERIVNRVSKTIRRIAQY